MNIIDNLLRDGEDLYDQWNLTEIPFAESAEKLDRLSQVFTGREKELGQVINLLRSRDSKSILVYGWIGIGKTAFVRLLLEGLKRNHGDRMLTARIRLEANTDLSTAALIALVRQMPNDEWAQYQLNRMGLRPGMALRNRTTTAGADMIVKGTVEESTVAPEAPQFPTLSFEDLLDRALQKHERVIIAIDDLDKQDPARARQLLLNAQGLLKGRACFCSQGTPAALPTTT